tara:strand:- start:410 stop:754 length:345 start_codon:yes stop_codon:yes gene_type:complete
MKFYITKRSNLLDCDGSALHDSLEVLEEFDDLNNCKKKFKSILKEIDRGNIIRKLQTKNKNNHGLQTLISEYRKIEIFKFWESEFIALEIIESKKEPKKFRVSDGVKNQGGYVY